MTVDRVDVINTSPTLFSEDLFKFWIDGMTVEECIKALQNHADVVQFNLSPDLLRASISDEYAQFSLLESAMHHPDTFVASPSRCSLDVQTRKQLVSQYYSLDDSVLRELTGSKLSTRFRRDLTEVAERSGVRLNSCRRQYENLRRVARLAEDSPGKLTDIIKKCFVLPQSLAEVYTAMIFISANRFETSKRCFANASFADFAYCAEQLMTYWTSNNTEPKPDAPVDLELDFEFCGELKALKLLSEKVAYSERHKSLVLRQLNTLVSTNCLSDLETNFKTLSKVIITIATGLSHAREVRDIFLDIVEKLIEPVVAAHWTYQDFSTFLTAFDEALRILPPARSSSFQRCWKRFFAPFKSISLRLFHLPED
nr:unnamed protein product [Spirometra erinaceieuropaei]